MTTPVLTTTVQAAPVPTTAVRRRPLARRAAVAVALLAGGLVLAGCAEEPPTPAPPAVVEGPTLTGEGYARILEQVNAALAAATEAKDPAKLESRVTGPALAVRTSQLQVAQIIGNTDLVTLLPPEYQQLMVSTQTEWPRTAFAITERTDVGTPRLIVLTQDSPRARYKLWGWVQLRPGVTMPQFADIKLGSEVLAPDDASLAISPQDVVGQYADLLTHGDTSEFVAAFEPAADDPFRSLIAMTTATQVSKLDPDNPQIRGTYAWSFSPAADTPIKSIRTADGGAVVLAALTGTETMGAVQGATIQWSGATAGALLKDQTPTNHLVQGFSDMIALYVPPKGSDQPVKLLGYSHVQTSASTAAPEG